MAKEVESTNEPSQSSSSLPPLAENEVELVIDRFWRDTRPRACVRSETKLVNGFNFRLLVWPQGSKQSQSHLSAFVEVVPAPAQDGKKDGDESGSSPNNRPYPPDWACPCVFYRISVMNFKQKYPYSKADTWTFSYVCPDRGWHTLLDTRYINRRDGYLSSEGSLVIRAVAYPRFAHPVPVLPLLANVTHISPVVIDPSSSSTSQSVMQKPGLGNFLATDHVNALLQSLFHLPGFRRLIYSLVRPGSRVKIDPSLTVVEMETIEQGLESCSETVKEIMNRLSAAAPEMSSMIESEFIHDSQSGGFCTCHSTASSGSCSKLEKLRHIYGRCQVLISCLEESLFSVSQSLFGRKHYRLDQASMKRTQFDAYRQIVRDCKRILSTVANPLFFVSTSDTVSSSTRNLVEELQLLFARMELGGSSSGTSGLLDTRGVLRELGVSSGGLLSAASPDGLFTVFYDALLKAIEKGGMVFVDGSQSPSPTETMTDLLFSSCGNEILLNHIRLNDQKPTSVDKHIAAWLEEDGGGVGFTKTGKVITLQLRNKIKDRLDVSERIRIRTGRPSDMTAVAERSRISAISMAWDEFLDHDCGNRRVVSSPEVDNTGASPPADDAENDDIWYRLHSVQMSWGSDVSSAHYSAIVRNHRLGGWTRYDDGWSEELVDLGASSGGPDWVFSPEWACSSLIYVCESFLGDFYDRSVDIRSIRPDIFSIVASCTAGFVEPSTCPVLCNRSLPKPPSSSTTDFDPSCQVEVCLVTEKDVVGAWPGGFSIPFNFSVNAAARKLIVRKDIAVDRLMQAVAEHFKIPVQMQKLFALKFYPETGQERFELMQSQRSVMTYLDAPKAAVSKTNTPKSASPSATTATTSHQLYVFVSASRGDATVWVKVLSEKDMGMVSLCSLSLDHSKPLRDYFSQVAAKHKGLDASTQFVVFEEVAPRVVELRRTSVAIKQEKIVNGDILIFVPLTDTAKRALIGTASACITNGGGHKYPKRRCGGDSAAAAPATAQTISSEDEAEDDDATSSVSDDVEIGVHSSSNLNDRCKRFLSRVRDEIIDDQYDDLLIGDSDDGSEDECKEECCGCREANRLNARIELVRRYLRHRPDDQVKLFDGMTRDELDRLMGKRRLDIPASLRDELSQHPISQRCFYCQLPLSAAAVGSVDQTCKVACTVSCVKSSVNYHDSCVKELVLENGGSYACIITEGCRGRIVLDSKSIDPPRMSQAALRGKLTTVLVTPAVPELGKNGRIMLNGKPMPIGFSGAKGSEPPAVPSALKGKKTGKASGTLPIEALWWNACLTAFGSFEDLHAAVVDKHWDSADLAQAKAIFVFWCRQFLEKKSKPGVVPPRKEKQPTPTTATIAVIESSDSSVSSDDSEAELSTSEAESESVELAKLLEHHLSESEDGGSDDGFILAGAKRRNKAHNHHNQSVIESIETPITRVPTPSSAVIIPEGFFGTAKNDEAAAEEAAASIAHQAVDSLLSLPCESAAPLSLVDSLILGPSSVDEDQQQQSSVVTPSPSLFESRMALLPVCVRQFCLPVDLVFVYYSVQFFSTSNYEANTVSLTPSAGGEDYILDTVTRASSNVKRIFTSPHQTFPDSPISVQWFVEFQSAQDSKKFSEFVSSACPEWGPETGALLPASVLGFAV